MFDGMPNREVVVIPKVLRKKLVSQGSCWWPGMDKSVKYYTKGCKECQ